LPQKLNTELDSAVITFYTYSLPFYGPEPKLVGAVSSLPLQVISHPIKGETAVFVARVFEEHQRSNVEINTLRLQENQMHTSKINYELLNSLKKVYKVIDNRTMYF